MSDVQIESTTDHNDDAAFEAEREAARQEQDGPIEDGVEEEEATPPADPDRERLEKLAKDKDGMARAERQKRRDAEARAEALEARLAALEGKKPADDLDFSTLKSVEEDPIGNIEAMRKLAEQMTAQQKATQAQTAQQQQFQAINTRMQSYEVDFLADNPDYNDAATHFRESRKAELEDMGYAGAELQAALTNDLVGLAVRSMQSGKDPAEVVYNLAKKRGFGVEIAKKVDEPSKTLQAVERGQKAGKSLSTVGAKTGDGALTAESVMKLDGAAFDAALAKLKAQETGRASSWRN